MLKNTIAILTILASFSNAQAEIKDIYITCTVKLRQVDTRPDGTFTHNSEGRFDLKIREFIKNSPEDPTGEGFVFQTIESSGSIGGSINFVSFGSPRSGYRDIVDLSSDSVWGYRFKRGFSSEESFYINRNTGSVSITYKSNDGLYAESRGTCQSTPTPQRKF